MEIKRYEKTVRIRIKLKASAPQIFLSKNKPGKFFIVPEGKEFCSEDCVTGDTYLFLKIEPKSE